MKTFLISGGTSGIGLETVKLLSGKGERIIVMSRQNNKPAEIPDTEFYNADVLNDSNSFPEISGPLHGLVYCPGTINLKPFRSLKTEDFQHDLDINFLGAVKIISKYLPNLKSAENASIVLFSTVAVQTGMPFHTSIASAKGAVEGLARSLAAEFAPTIRVNCIAPSVTDTPLAEKLLNSESKLKASSDRHPLKRTGKAEEIAELTVFLLSDKSGFITGQIIKADGGISSVRTF